MNYNKLRKSILLSETDIEYLSNLKDQFAQDFSEILKGSFKRKDIDAFIRLCLDYYAYSGNGDVLISDREYDILMQYWVNNLGEDHIVFPDVIVSDSTWRFIKHDMPGMVGTVSKVYSKEELAKYINKYKGITDFIVAPKYDGISSCIDVKNGEIAKAVTRADGITGQDISLVVKGACNSANFALKENNMRDGYYKCELCVGQSNFEKLIEEKKYANRRSATSGIVNSPKNLIYAKYITIIPLLYNDGNDNIKYFPPNAIRTKIDSVESAMDEIHKMMAKIKSSDFQFRTDGVILYPISKDLTINDADYMSDAKAYKINTAEGRTTIDYGYMSIGRMGNAIPMIKVKPVEVNEIIVTDISLGSYDKYAGTDLHENETVVVYAAGDVIPQMKLPDPREYPKGSDYLKISLECPYCHERLERIGADYKCINPNCERVITGKITNFLVKLGSKNISDKTIEFLYENKLVKNIEDLFILDSRDIEVLQGFDTVSAVGITTELKRLFTEATPISKVFGALGMENISEKKCRKIFTVVDIDTVMNKSYDKIYMNLINASGIGPSTAEIFARFVKDNHHMINYIINHMNISKDIEYKGNVVFTGFRNETLKNNLQSIGFDVSDSVNSKTVAVVDASKEHVSPKCKAAFKKGVSVINLSEIDELIKELKLGKIIPQDNSTIEKNALNIGKHISIIEGQELDDFIS